MNPLLLTIILIIIAVLITIGLFFLYIKDKTRIQNVAAVLGVGTRFTFLKGWVAESTAVPSKIWITRWEDPSYDGPAMLIYFKYSVSLPFPIILVNRKSSLAGLPFERPFSRPRGLKKSELNEIHEGLQVYCRNDDIDICTAFITNNIGRLNQFARISEEEDATFNLGRSQLRISVDLDKGPHEIKRIYDAALPIVEVINTLDLKKKC